MFREDWFNATKMVENKKNEKLWEINIKEDLTTFKKDINIQKVNPIIAYLDKFDEYFKKKKKRLEVWQILFSPGIDNNFYIIVSGILTIINITPTWEKKEIWKADKWSFIWEGIIFGRNQKDVEVICAQEAEVIALNIDDLAKFEADLPKEAILMYKYIIEVSNKRLLESGKELANIYEATNKIIELSKTWEKWFIDIMDYSKKLFGARYIIYVENHQVLSGLLFYKYDTRFKNVGVINKKVEWELTPNSSWIINSDNIFWAKKEDNILAIPLKMWPTLKWFFLVGKEKWVITDNEIRIWNNLSPLIAWVIDNNQKESERKYDK